MRLQSGGISDDFGWAEGSGRLDYLGWDAMEESMSLKLREK